MGVQGQLEEAQRVDETGQEEEEEMEEEPD